MTQLCATRTIKNARFLQRTAPHIIPKEEPLGGFGSRVPEQLLMRLHQALPAVEAERVPGLADALRRSPPPRRGAVVKEPLFRGSLVFAQVAFRTSRGSASVNPRDTAISMAYARLAVRPISAYAAQYGPNDVGVGPGPVAFTASAPSGRYNDQTLQAWVNEIVRSNGLAATTCVVVLNPPGIVNVDADPSKGVGGYHNLADVPYAFVNVMASNLTVKDEANAYALALSHEIAEMVVDPRADLVNPEVADPCSFNCQRQFLDYFDAAGGYLGSSETVPPPFDYAFFINAIVKPGAVTQCPAPPDSCAYAPP